MKIDFQLPKERHCKKCKRLKPIAGSINSKIGFLCAECRPPKKERIRE